MVYREFDLQKTSIIEKIEVKILIFLVGLAMLMAIPICLRDGLYLAYPNYYWANSLNIFLDWSIYYLDFLPLWIIINLLWLLKRLTILNLFKWSIVFFLGYWLFFDWTWQFLIIQFDPSHFDWNSPFYFDIIIPNPPMLFFLIISIFDFFLSILILKIDDSYYNLLPFGIYLIYIYLIGGIAEVIHLDNTIYLVYSIIFISLIIISIFIALMKRKKNDRD